MKAFIAILVGTAFVIASAGVANNYLDIEIDKAMERTKDRALVTGKITPARAAVFSFVLAMLGFWALLMWTNGLAAVVGLTGWVFYVAVYGYFKRRSVHGTLIGSISGAMPPVAGYVAATGHIDSAAVVLFIILALWQMPHFFAIAMYRVTDYRKAKLPVLSVKAGLKRSQEVVINYILALLLTTPLLTILGYTGFIYLIMTTGIVLFWLIRAQKSQEDLNREKWAKQVFLNSLKVMATLSLALAVGARLP